MKPPIFPGQAKHEPYTFQAVAQGQFMTKEAAYTRGLCAKQLQATVPSTTHLLRVSCKCHFMKNIEH